MSRSQPCHLGPVRAYGSKLSLCGVGLLTCAALFSCGPISFEESPETVMDGEAGPGPVRIVAIGDIHGDLEAARGALRVGGLIDDTDQWIGAQSIVVQVGDILDRGDDERAILELFDSLKDEAQAMGGDVVVLNGNHEIMTVAGYYDYATEGTCNAFQDLEGMQVDDSGLDELSDACRYRAAAFLPGGPYARLLAEHPVVQVIGDSVFVHGGLFESHLDYGLERVNEETSAWMRAERELPPAAVDYTTNSMVWTRTYSVESVAQPACEILTGVLDRLGVERMVVAHTVQPSINAACGGRVWRIDTGMSAYFDGSVEVLEIFDGEVSVLNQVGSR